MLTVMDDNGSMWQISIDGSKVKVVNSAPTQVSIGSRQICAESVTSIPAIKVCMHLSSMIRPG